MKKRENYGIRIISNVALILLAVMCIIPFMTVISSSLTNEDMLVTYGYNVIPRKFDISAYKTLFSNANTLINSYKVTIFVTAVGTFGAILVGSQFAYVISRKECVFAKYLSVYLFITMLFSGGMGPWYILITRYLHLKDSLWALILPCLVNACNIFLLKSNLSAVPNEVIESARIY